MATKNTKLELAKKVASKVKTNKRKKVSSDRYLNQGQNHPQSKAWTEANDEGVVAKNIGWRWTKIGATRLSKNENAKPSGADIEKYKNKTFTIKGETHRYLYSEKRVDKSDKNRSVKFKDGGGIKQSKPQSQSYKRSADSKVEAKPVGWRYKGNNYNEPSERVINREKQKPRDERAIYFETRKDKSDHDFYAKLEDGGTLGAGSFAKGGYTQSGRQYPNYNEDMDGQKMAKPVGYRFTDRLAKRLGVSPHSVPTEAQIEKYNGNGIYFEQREDKTDIKPSKKYISLGHGGDTQGYDDREDERLGMEHGRISSKDFVGSHEQMEHSRRDDARFEERMADGGTLGAGSFAKGGSTFGGRQYNPYNADMDGQKIAKPIGYRFTDRLARRLGINPHSRPSVAQIEKYLGRGIYFENREDKSDAKPSNKFLSYEEGGTMGAGSFARGGVERITNSESRTYSENMIPFKGANLEGKTLDNGDYVVLSYGYYPIWWYSKSEGKWYGNSTKFSVTTSKQMSQSRPTYDATMLSRNDLEQTMMKHSAKFENGGMLDGILGDTNVPMQNVGGTTFSSADLTSHMDLTNPAF